MDSNSGIFEYCVKRRADGKLIRKKVLTVATAVALVLAGSYALAYVNLGASLAFAVIVFFVLSHFWYYFDVEYEYIVGGGEFEMAAVYGKRKRKVLARADSAEIEAAGRAHDRFADRVASPGVKRRLDFSSSLDGNAELCFIIYNDKKDGRTLMFFDGPEKVANHDFFRQFRNNFR